MDKPSTQLSKLNNAVVELKRLARLEGIETLLIVAANHETENRKHHFHSIGSMDGCDCCAMESLGRMIGARMDEMAIAGLLDSIQTAYAERCEKTFNMQAVDETREVVLS